MEPENNDLEARITALVEQIRISQGALETYTLEIQQCKQQLLPLLEQRGDNWADTNGYARLVREGLQRVYDAEALDRLILSDPLHYGWLKDYRRERMVSPRLAVK